MTNVMDYIKWRGDLLFSQDPPNEIDALIFATVSYIRFGGDVAQKPSQPVDFRSAAEELLGRSDWETRGRNRNDMELLRAAAQTQRFGNCRIVGYQDLLIPGQDTQFAAVTFLLDDGSLFLAFRGTDNTLVGWKEDFNMCFQQAVPAQLLAVTYTRSIYAEYSGKMRLGGHSKGGNLAVFAAARSSPTVQQRIEAVYSMDGPGFSEYLMGDPGYLAMVPKIHTFIPQSSIIGMIMEREEETTIVKSSQVSIFQHDTFSWEVQGKSFILQDALTQDSIVINRTIKNWLAGMGREERNQMVDILFDVLSAGETDRAADIFRLRNVRRYAKEIGNNELARKVLSEDFQALINAAKQRQKPAEPMKLDKPE